MGVMLDPLFPELLKLGDRCVLGMNTLILTHEYDGRDFCTGRVDIGAGAVVGANSTILPGVTIGEGALIGASSLVNGDVPEGAFAAGVPARILRPGPGQDR